MTYVFLFRNVLVHLPMAEVPAYRCRGGGGSGEARKEIRACGVPSVHAGWLDHRTGFTTA